MKRILIIILFLACSFSIHAQRSKVLAAFQLIEHDKFEEAKLAVEDAIMDKKTKDWTKAWYARGLLAQTAYEKGIKEKDKKKYELYPDQLFVAYDSYQKSLKLNKNGRMDNQIAPLMVKLANDFLKIAENSYKKEDYKTAFRGFEHALKINMSSILSIELDTSLLYNTALAAYQSGDWEMASKYLQQLNDYKFSPNIPQLLNVAYLAKGDTISAENTLEEGVKLYDYDKDLVLLYADMLYQKKEFEKAVLVLNSAAIKDSSNAVFYYTKGLLYQKLDEYQKAIKAYEQAVNVNPDKVEAYANIASCYYNMAVEIEEKARNISDLNAYRAEKLKSDAARESALSWYEKAYEKNPGNKNIREQLNQLSQFLGSGNSVDAP
jgi:tetratricopeptide (TPR) repeat protein